MKMGRLGETELQPNRTSVNLSPPRRISVIIPTLNRHKLLRSSLCGLADQSFPHSAFQVVVVNDGGAEIPSEVINEWDGVLNLKVLNQANRGQSAARNFGAFQAEHDWLAFLDDDCVPAPDWLVHFADAFGREPEAVLGGETLNGLRGNAHSDASQCLMLYLYEYYHRLEGKHSQRAYFTSNNLALSAYAFRGIGGFDETMRFAEDRDLCARLTSAGYKLAAIPEARVLHYRALDFKSFWRQHQSYGGGAYHYYQNRMRAGAKDFRMEPFRFYAGMLQYPATYAPNNRGRLTALITLSQFANAFGFLRALIRASANSRNYS
jgi:cellulose synthase/poly-beta-1,6-N-acetylglucosamine synthase-like glycosyltransferase